MQTLSMAITIITQKNLALVRHLYSLTFAPARATSTVTARVIPSAVQPVVGALFAQDRLPCGAREDLVSCQNIINYSHVNALRILVE